MKKAKQHSATVSLQAVDETLTIKEPFRASSFEHALKEIKQTLSTKNCLILKGEENSGKSTLVKTFIKEEQNKQLPTAYIDTALKKPSELYLYLSKILHTDKTKKAILNALINLKKNDQYALLVLDQDAIDTYPQVTGVLQQLCVSNESVSGSIKLVVVRRDYLVIPKDILPSSDFHHWITNETVLKPLAVNNIDGYIKYLAKSLSVPVPPYTLGTDTQLIEISAGRIGKLESLLTPVITKDVISINDLHIEAEDAPLDVEPRFKVQPPVIVASGCVLLMGVALITYLTISFQEKQATIIEKEKPIFAEPGTPTPTIKAPYQTSKKPVFFHKEETSSTVSTPGGLIAPQQASTAKKTEKVLPITSVPVEKAPSEAIMIEHITRTIDHWLLAWQTRNFSAYTQHYQDTFKTDKADSHSEWKLQRQRALARPKWLKLQRSALDDFSIEDKQVTVRFWIKYESSTGYRDRTLKKIQLKKENNQWLISSEINEIVRRGF